MLLPSRRLSSAVVEVSAVDLARILAVPDCIPASVTSSASASSEVPTALACICSARTASSSIKPSLIASGAIFPLVTAEFCILVVVTA